VGECAELRRQLGQVLAVLDGQAAAPGTGQAALVLAALEDASGHIRGRAANCGECEASPAELCDGCSDRLDRADAYDDLAAGLREAAR
jgi:hypothetical protein